MHIVRKEFPWRSLRTSVRVHLCRFRSDFSNVCLRWVFSHVILCSDTLV